MERVSKTSSFDAQSGRIGNHSDVASRDRRSSGRQTLRRRRIRPPSVGLDSTSAPISAPEFRCTRPNDFRP